MERILPRTILNRNEQLESNQHIRIQNNIDEGNLDIEISAEEVVDIVKSLKYGKAPGHDKITTEMIKQLGNNGIEMLRELFNKAWHSGEVPDDWKRGIIIPIHKKGDTKDCKNYRGVTLLSAVAKMYENILEGRVKQAIEYQLEESQSGFRKGRCIQDHIFSIKQITEKALLQQKDIYLAFVDLEKAFDSVSQPLVWESLRRRGINGKLLRGIKSLYKENKNYVRISNWKSDIFEVREGLRQGGVLSPTLFIIVMDDIIKGTRDKIKKVHIGYNKLRPVEIGECVFADDITICAKSERDLQINLTTWNEELAKRNMKINPQKTKVMVIGKRTRTTDIKIGDQKIEQVDIYKYLGVLIQREGNMEEEINERLSSAAKIYHALSKTFLAKREIANTTKTTVYKTIFRPILTFGGETWNLTNNIKSRVQAMEMKFLRRILGITRRNRVRNERNWKWNQSYRGWRINNCGGLGI